MYDIYYSGKYGREENMTFLEMRDTIFLDYFAHTFNLYKCKIDIVEFVKKFDFLKIIHIRKYNDKYYINTYLHNIFLEIKDLEIPKMCKYIVINDLLYLLNRDYLIYTPFFYDKIVIIDDKELMFQNQKNLTKDMFVTLNEWLYHICLQLKCDSIFNKIINVLITFFIKNPDINRNQLQIYGMLCMMLLTGKESLENIQYLCVSLYSVEQLSELRLILFNTLIENTILVKSA